jgi:hypothetical protein
MWTLVDNTPRYSIIEAPKPEFTLVEVCPNWKVTLVTAKWRVVQVCPPWSLVPTDIFLPEDPWDGTPNTKLWPSETPPQELT